MTPACGDVSSPDVVALYLTEAPYDPCWRLRPFIGPAWRGLLGWQLTDAPVDAGVPASVARLLSNAWTDCGRVTYLRPDPQLTSLPSEWAPTSDGFACRLVPSRWWYRLGHWLGRPELTLFSTNRAEDAVELFEAGAYSWDLEVQAVFLSDFHKPPRLTYDQVFSLLHRRQIDSLNLKERAHVYGVALPGVDGDFAELLAFTPQLWQALEKNLARRCQAEGIGWRVVSEQQFREIRWCG